MTLLTWIGILLCLSQSAMFSGLNLAFFSINKLELEIEARRGNPRAQRVRALRQDANFLLVTVLWGNVAVNVLLALLSGSVMGAVAAFLFSTVVITLLAEILPQAFFSRHALHMAALFTPLMRIYHLLLWPVARPTAWMLDRWLGGGGDSLLPRARPAPADPPAHGVLGDRDRPGGGARGHELLDP
ncbi:DUF21 domain-containing protein [Halomonas campaniensis]|uniref:DUF21 domain-containing protein n=1 Tax=Halomonas campaniensis TaxID=213554 RepID=UPI0035619140